jgi:homoserine O-acetyltransferase/O-succinyltransferase
MESATQAGSVGVVATQFVDLPAPLRLDSGAELSSVRIAYETYGALAPERDNVVLVCHALSGDAHAAGWAPDGGPTALDGIGADERGVRPKGGLGWWDGMIGPGKPFDTDRFHVVCTNLLGGCRGTTGPGSTNPETGRPYGSAFPVITIADMVRAQRAFLDELEIERVLCVTGASMGGMQALQWTIDQPDDVDLCLGIATTAHLDARGLALNAVARNAITTDPDWQGGDYYGTGREPRAGLALARQVGHVTYLSKEALRGKSRGGRFGVESYLDHQAQKFVDRFDANTYRLFSRALTRFELTPAQLSAIRAPVLLISFTSDWIYPPADSEELAAGLPRAQHAMLETAYGHDSFLLEADLQAPAIRRFLERTYEETR